MPVPTTGVTELVMEVRDLAASEQFYTGVLGLPVIGRWEGKDPNGHVVEFWTRDVATQTAAGPPHAKSLGVQGVDG